MLTAIATYFITAALAAKFNVNVWHLQVFRILGVLSSSFFMSLFVAVQVPMFGGYMDSGFGPYWALVWYVISLYFVITKIIHAGSPCGDSSSSSCRSLSPSLVHLLAFS